MENFKFFFQFIFKIQAFSSKLLSRFRQFLPSYFQDQAFSSKLLPRSGIFFQVISKIRHFLPNYFQDSHISCKILQDQTFSSKIFQDTCKNNALSSKIFEVKSDRFLQKFYGSSTRADSKRRTLTFCQFVQLKETKRTPEKLIQVVPRSFWFFFTF